MEKLTYTRFQRDMEIALFRLQQYLQICATDGVEAARALVEPTGDFPEGCPPEEIPVEHLPIYDTINILEAYAYEQNWHENLFSHCENLKLFIRAIAHPEVISEWKTEAGHVEEIDLVDGENTYWHTYGNYYRGILEDINCRASARLKLDERNHLTLRDIAYLAELNERSVMNAVHAKGPGQLQTDGKDSAGRSLVDSTVAIEWLESKERFKSTKGINQDGADQTPLNPDDEDEWVFVPEARDGSRFLPDLGTRNGFRIGMKGEEWTAPGYLDALEALVQMKNPSWRRKNKAGNAGIVTGVHWVKISLTDLQKEYPTGDA